MEVFVVAMAPMLAQLADLDVQEETMAKTLH